MIFIFTNILVYIEQVLHLFCLSMALISYSYVNPILHLEHSSFFLKDRNGHTLKVRQSWDPLNKR